MLVYQRVPKVIHLQVDLILCFEKGEKKHFTIILPSFYLYLPTYIYLYLPTYIYLYLPIFTYIYLYLPIFAYIYLNLHIFT